MKIALFSGTQELCVLHSGDETPPGMPTHEIAHRIVEFFRDGHWIWVNGDKKAIRYASITSMEILPENSVEELSEQAPAD